MVIASAMPATAGLDPVATATWIAFVVALVVAIAERLHAARVRRVGRLAFGASGTPAAWTRLVPAARVIAAAVLAWGAVVLLLVEASPPEVEPSRATSRHVLFALDVSPSMLIEDAGPGNEKETRAIQGGRVAQGVLDRLDPATTRVSLVAFYTDALPVITETFDKEVVANALDGLPMYVAFEAGATRLQHGVAEAMTLARGWMPGSATLVVVSDGDALDGGAPPRVPPSIADVIVVGVGDPHRSTVIAGHASRQDSTSLKQLAARLGGIYHDGNEKQVPSEVLARLTMIAPRLSDGFDVRAVAIVATVSGASLLASIGPMLVAFGGARTRTIASRDRSNRASRAEVAT